MPTSLSKNEDYDYLRYFIRAFFIFLIVRLRQEEKRQQEETNRVKERKRKREKYAEKVSQTWGG